MVWTDNNQPLHRYIPLLFFNHQDLFPCPRVGCILPQLITAGTVTRRGVESTWLTASNPKVYKDTCVMLQLYCDYRRIELGQN